MFLGGASSFSKEKERPPFHLSKARESTRDYLFGFEKYGKRHPFASLWGFFPKKCQPKKKKSCIYFILGRISFGGRPQTRSQGGKRIPAPGYRTWVASIWVNIIFSHSKGQKYTQLFFWVEGSNILDHKKN